MYEHVKAQTGQYSVLELGVLVHDDCDDADIGQEAPGPAHHVLLGEPVLPGGIQATIIHAIVVALRQKLDGSVLFFVKFEDAMYDGNVATLDLEDFIRNK